MSLRRPSLARSLAVAYAGARGCPDPQTFLAESLRALDPGERRRIELHAERCPACSAEREMARAFDEGVEDHGEGRADVDWVVARLERARFARGHGAPRRAIDWRWASAAALVVAAAVALLALSPAPPPLAPRSDSPVVLRGATIEIISPAGELAQRPDELRFETVERAELYRVRLLGVDDTVVWDATVGAPPLRLPATARDALREAVAYRWQVEALDGTGTRLALSGQATFRIVPGAR